MNAALERAARRIRRFIARSFFQRDEAQALLLGTIASRLCAGEGARSLRDSEFRVFSQFGEDGIIQYLLRHVPIENDIFVEFGVEDYTESNTRFLLMHNNWRGIVFDSNAENVCSIQRDALYWKHDLSAAQATLTAENINQLLEEYSVPSDIGLLSIDIDGMDYWVWKAISTVEPRIVVCEYNSVLGASRAITVPYQADFRRHVAHYSGLYFGASLPALIALGRIKGYAFVGSNSHGTNAFFVRRDLVGSLRELTAEEGYVLSRTRESRDQAGRLTFLAGEARRQMLRGLEFYDLRTESVIILE